MPARSAYIWKPKHFCQLRAATLIASSLVSGVLLLGAAAGHAQRTPVPGDAPSESRLRQMLAQGKPGDTVFIPGGIYRLSEPVVISLSGTKKAWITIMPRPGEEVVLDGSDYLSAYDTATQPRRMRDSGVLTVRDARFVRLKNITVRNAHTTGILITGKSTSHVELMHCKTDGSYNSGIGLWYADSCKILHCEVTKANDMERIPVGLRRPSEAPHEAISIAGATHFEVAHNLVHDCYKEGIDVKEVSAYGTVHHNKVYRMRRQGLYVDSWFGRLHHIEFHHNEVHDCEWGMAVSAEDKNSSMDSVFIHHNLLYNNRGSGVLFGVWGSDEKRSHIYVYNNTVVNNGSAGHWGGLTGGIDIRSSNLRHVYIYNNISAFNYGFAVGSSVPPSQVAKTFGEQNIVVTHNAEWQVNAPPPEKSRIAFFPALIPLNGDLPIKTDPRFDNAKAGDFTLPPRSGLRRAGWKQAPHGKALYLGATAK